MAAYLFTKAVMDGKPIKVFNNGDLYRDFTFIEDIIDGIIKVINKPSKEGYELYNIGNNNPAHLLDFIVSIENTPENGYKEFYPYAAWRCL